MNAITVHTLHKLKQQQEKIVVLTAYDASYAKLLGRSGVEVLLIGDTLGAVIQGHNDTLPVTVQDIAYHTACVARARTQSLIMADMPFMAHTSVAATLTHAATFMRSGAHMVKLEGDLWLKDHVQALNQYGIPCCVHLGLTPQSVHKMGGYRVQGRNADDAQAMIDTALSLEAAGADMLLLECVPAELAKRLTQAVRIPVIGIGAGADVDGQVLVLYDMLGITGSTLRFVKNFMTDASSIEEAIKNYVTAVKQGRFPTSEHAFV